MNAGSHEAGLSDAGMNHAGINGWYAALLERAPWVVIGLALLVFGAGLGLRDPWPADEPVYSLIARDMLRHGNWLIPGRPKVLLRGVACAAPPTSDRSGRRPPQPGAAFFRHLSRIAAK